jgi:hypothetical protein
MPAKLSVSPGRYPEANADIERAVGGLRDDMRARFPTQDAHYDAIYRWFDRLETEYQVLVGDCTTSRGSWIGSRAASIVLREGSTGSGRSWTPSSSGRRSRNCRPSWLRSRHASTARILEGRLPAMDPLVAHAAAPGMQPQA